MVGESNRNVFLIQIDVSKFAEFETSEFEISRVDCILQALANKKTFFSNECNEFAIESYITYGNLRKIK